MRLSRQSSATHTILIAVLVLVLQQTGFSQPLPSPSFEAFIADRFARSDASWTLEKFCPVTTNVVAARVLREYGAVYAAGESVTLPPVCIWNGESEVLRFQKSVKTRSIEPGGLPMIFQEKAADSLHKAISEALEQGLRITPLDGVIAGSRSYGDTLMLWNGRFFSGLDYWTKRGRLTAADRDNISRVDLQKRIEMILAWESRGMFFSTDKSRSILSSVAPPGTSQHLSMLAFDVVEYGQPAIREIMNRNGWFQTVVGDPTHFTFLDLPESALPGRGLRPVERGRTRYWVPNILMATR